MSIAKNTSVEPAIKNPNALSKTLKVKSGKNISESKLEKSAHYKNKLTAKRARLAEILRKFH